MTLIRWAEADRETLNQALPEALVILPVGATEQHGRHLATGTDALLAATTSERAAELAEAAAGRPIVLAPALNVGASDHHRPFGGTLSLAPETLLAVLLDLARSVAASGGRRLVIVNGHGGNSGLCSAAAAAASARHDIAVAYLDYWCGVADEAGVPGHAGEFETSLVLALRPELVSAAKPRDDVPAPPTVPHADLHSARIWRDIDGYTDRPERATAEQGEQRLDAIVSVLAQRFVEFARVL